MRPVQFTLHDQWSQSSDPPLLPVRITPELLPVLRWWSLSVNLTSGVPLHQPLPDLRLFTDASSEGWGAHLLSHQTGGLWDSVQKRLHINVLELLAVRLALQHFLPLVQGQPVMVMTDNTTVVAQLRNQGGMLSRPLYSHTAQLLLWADSHNVSLVPRHIPGKLNVIADRLSRRHQVLNSEWTLSLSVLHQVWRLWGQLHVDMFATADNARLPTFVSPLPDPRAWRIDALSFTWTGLWIYLFPPFPLLPEVLRRISLTHCQAILIAPAWPSQPWFPLLLRLLVDLPRQLPLTRTLLRQPSSRVFHQEPLCLSLHAWRLSGPLSNERDFQRTWHSELLQHTACQHSLSTTASGDFSVTGLPSRVEIHPLPLLPN